MKDNIYFVSGIGTDIGKTYATGFLAAKWRSEGINAITQKFIQTGCTAMSEDILTHRRIMGMKPNEDDVNQITCGQMFSAKIVWESSNPKVVSVSDDGTIKALRRGTAKITAKTEDGKVSDSINVTVEYSTIQWIIVYILFGWIWYL